MKIYLNDKIWRPTVENLLSLLGNEVISTGRWIDIRDYVKANGINVDCSEISDGIFEISEEDLILFKLKYS